MMKKLTAVILALLLMLGSLCATAYGASYYKPGMQVDDFTVTLADGTEANLHTLLQQYKGVVINIWATWCYYCVLEFPYMNEAYDMYKDQIALLCLSPYDSNKDIAAFMKQYGLTLPMGYDSAKLSNRLVREGYPTTVVIDRTGTCIYYECGAMTSTDAFVELFGMLLDDESTPAEAEYTIRCVDENGNPVTGVLVNVCSDAFCNPAMVDKNGVLSFSGESRIYTIHVLTVPKGYVFDLSAGFEMPAGGGELVITIPHQ